MIRVLLVDDQPLIRLGFGAILGSEDEIEVVGEAADGRAAVELAAELDPDVICMDVQMPHMDGIEATRALVAAGTRAAILILTTFDRDDFLFETLAAGASGFLLKSAGPEELIEAVRVLGRGDALLDPQVTRRVLARLAAPPFEVTSPGSAGSESGRSDPDVGASGGSDPKPRQAGATTTPAAHDAAGSGVTAGSSAAAGAGLTPRESEILALMARGLSNAEIAAELFVGESTVKTHVSNVLMKLQARDRVHAVIWAFEHGLAG
ncbi:response regulator [Micrococcus luteus]|uniref:response regulator n=1 Tax=Micrococcus luteus TaxID=1270 RepID=UPI002002D59C|nr:response regulator transcription factor [Micrococcus luteus]MCK6057271.1 response regulator transcription factor [Micrococcus luteus]MCK6062234.1 response regulator transcription factor [Micrococcus luteus]MCK6064402.1 response regulator transcription factor [Micrococcus luteus]MCK6192060.1 response regulator transcription factor [Micrococcus luteus]MCK6194140.1 response regulator transcription factor [Micrococcus luteus]